MALKLTVRRKYDILAFLFLTFRVLLDIVSARSKRAVYHNVGLLVSAEISPAIFFLH